MLSDDDSDPEPIMPDVIYETSGVTLGPRMPAPFRLVPEAASAPYADDSQTLDIQYVLRGGRVMRQPPPAAAARPLGGTSSQEEVRAEDDEILRQLQSTQARISIWSLLASSSTHRDALTRALSQIRVDTTTTPEGLIHMMTAGRATCIVFSDDDLPPEGSGHTRPLYISVGCSGRRVPSVLLDNGSALNVCPLATAIALGYAPSDFGPSTQTVRAYDSTRRRSWVLRIPTSFNLLLGRPWIHRAGAIPSSLHQKVKFIHDGRVVVVQSVGDMFISAEPVLEISHADDDLFLTGFTFDEVQTLEMEDFCRDFVALSFDQHSSTVVLDIMRSMAYLPGMGLGRRQHGPREERVRARLTHTPFYYPVRPYTMSLADYFVRASEPHAPSDGIIGGLSTTQEAELQRLVQQLQLSDGAPGPSASVLIAPPSPDRTSLMTLCFPDEIDDHGTFAEIGDVEDGAVPRDEYIDEMLAMSLSQTEEIAPPELASPFDLFGVSVLEIAGEIQVAPTLEVVEDVVVAVDLFDGPVGLIFDIDDEIAQHDSDDDSSPASDSDPVDQRVSPAVGDTEIVDFGTADQPRELRIGSDLSTDERDSLIQLLRSYLDVFAWSYEDMPGLDPSIVQHRERGDPEAAQCRILSVVEYPEWLANVVPVPKKDGKYGGSFDVVFMDGFSGYSQILMAPEDMEKTSFITEWGTYCYRVMPFGLKNAGATYQRAATTLFHDMMHRDVEVYVDDMIVKSRDRSDHLAALERFFERIRQFRLRLNPKKCTFGVTSGKLLGYMVSERGIEVDPDKIRAILDMPAPRTEREVRGFLGRLQYISRFIARLTDICEPIFRLLRKSQPTVWDDQCQRAFERIREYLLSPPVLAPPTPGRPLLLYLSVSDVALGCMLAQLDDSGKDRAIYYLSKRMLDYETRPALVGRLMRWLVLLTEFDIHYVTQKSIRGSIVADHLASLPVSDARAIDDDFPDEDVAAVTSLSVRLAFSDRHPATNNIVEYEACISGLETALELGIRQMEVFGDSNLVLRQIQGEWKTRDVKLKPYHAYLELLVGRFDDLRYTHLPRAQNQFADALATLASMIDIPVDATVRPLLIESRSAPAYCCLIDDAEPDDGLPWYHDIYHFLRLGVYPEAATAKDKRALSSWLPDSSSVARHCTGDHLTGCYYCVWTAPLPIGILLVDHGDRLLPVCSRCPECQIHGTSFTCHLRVARTDFTLAVFSMGYRIIGKISPKSSSGHEFILVAIDYFTKWVEAASYARLTSSGVASFIRSHIICRYGVPHELISDRGVHFRAEVDTLVQRYSIRHHRSSAYRPQTNGAVEAANKNIKRILRRMVETSRDWSEKLPFALWAYRTSFRTSTALEQQIPEADWAQARFDQLNLLDERRLRAADHVRAYQRKMARLSKSGSSPDHCMELTPEGAAWLMDLDGNRFSEPTNVDQLKSGEPPQFITWRIVTSFPHLSHGHWFRDPWFEKVISSERVFCSLSLGDHPEAMGSDVVFSSLYLDRSDSVVFGLPGSFMDPHGLARSSLTGCSSRRRHDRYLTESLRSTQPGPHFSTLGFHHASPSGSRDSGWVMSVPGSPRHHFSARRSFSHMSVTVSITRSRYIVFASLTVIPELFIDMSSQRSIVRDS
ncbi:Retrovirus-related Pol polyprotein from transposon 17.6 [Vitis vinifera]|uniref:Retrovirus-related Pol polyprotein from transposon 17.6 n=1 Tax=Vitis vinifera TaxID=29760 RepID=A0A438J6T5_VITVI|nr:Retrovirus-related Pol polyprotein from transposon 17.6 [Vitis vinifera]